MKRKICITTGTRAEYGVIKPFLNEIKKSKEFKLSLIVTGMHLKKKFGMTINEIKKDRFEIHAIINEKFQGNTNYDMTKSLASKILKFADIFYKLNPDYNIVIGDRDEMLASAIAAYHMNIVNVHIHGGEVSGGLDEYNRHAITKISNIHFAPTKKSKERIIKMGENPKYVFNVGALAVDGILSKNITTLKKFELKYKINLKNNSILLLQHPVTTESERSKFQIKETLNALSELKIQTVAILPNSDPGNSEIIEELKIFSKQNKFFNTYPSFPREDFLCLLKNSNVLVGNSSSGIIEASYFSTPVINIGKRQRGRELTKNVMNISENSDLIKKSILRALNTKSIRKDDTYGKGNTSQKILKILSKVNLEKTIIDKQFVD